ncbi:hypothetical protein ACFLT9_04395, partial [Acidobacteriota bacterium]
GYYLLIGIVGFIIFFGFFLKWLHYKGQLKRDSQLRSGVNDEMTAMNWLKAFRFAFFSMVLGIPILEILKVILANVFGIATLLLNAHLIFYVGIMSCLASFLHFDRKSRKK